MVCTEVFDTAADIAGGFCMQNAFCSDQVSLRRDGLRAEFIESGRCQGVFLYLTVCKYRVPDSFFSGSIGVSQVNPGILCVDLIEGGDHQVFMYEIRQNKNVWRERLRKGMCLPADRRGAGCVIVIQGAGRRKQQDDTE